MRKVLETVYRALALHFIRPRIYEVFSGGISVFLSSKRMDKPRSRNGHFPKSCQPLLTHIRTHTHTWYTHIVGPRLSRSQISPLNPLPQMWSTLPPELIDRIVDEIPLDIQGISALKSLSRVASPWTTPCQRRLWRKVTIYTDLGSKGDRKTQNLAREITDHPYITSYIQCLHYRAFTPGYGKRSRQIGDLKRVARLISCMTNVTELVLEYGEKFWTGDLNLAFDDSPALWQEAVLGLIRSASLRRLTLKGISRIPADSLANALVNLERLTLLKCHFTWSHCPAVFPDHNP